MGWEGMGCFHAYWSPGITHSHCFSSKCLWEGVILIGLMLGAWGLQTSQVPETR